MLLPVIPHEVRDGSSALLYWSNSPFRFLATIVPYHKCVKLGSNLFMRGFWVCSLSVIDSPLVYDDRVHFQLYFKTKHPDTKISSFRDKIKNGTPEPSAVFDSLVAFSSNGSNGDELPNRPIFVSLKLLCCMVRLTLTRHTHIFNKRHES